MTWAIVKALNLMRNKNHDEPRQGPACPHAHTGCRRAVSLGPELAVSLAIDASGPPSLSGMEGARDFRALEGGETSVHQLRVDHAHSRLIHATWAAAVTARLKDEEALIKRRGAPKAAPPRSEKGDKGRGRGGRKSDQEEQQ